MDIIKNSGERVRFEPDKLKRSLRQAGAEADLAEAIWKELEPALFEGMSSQEIYDLAFAKLRFCAQGVAAKYRLKKALLELGPSGYPFERLVARLFEQEQFHCEVGITLPGHCVRHEVDVVARRGQLCRLTECKFRNMKESKVDVKVSLYVEARMRDLSRGLPEQNPDYRHLDIEGWLATNSSFTEDAERYALCSGLRLLGWAYPEGNGIKDRLDRAKLHPLTCLSSLSENEKQQLLEAGLVFCRDLLAQPQTVDKIGLSKARRRELDEELQSIMRLP